MIGRAVARKVVNKGSSLSLRVLLDKHICINILGEGNRRNNQNVHSHSVENNSQCSKTSILNAFKLFEEKCTIPFIARYRRAQTGNADSVTLTKWLEVYGSFEKLQDRKKKMMEELSKRNDGSLTQSLKQSILESSTLTDLEDIYLPYRRARCTKAETARKAGLEPLALQCFQQKCDDAEITNQIKKISRKIKKSEQDCLQMLTDLIAEKLSEDAAVRSDLRDFVLSQGMFKCSVKKSTKLDRDGPSSKKRKHQNDGGGKRHGDAVGTYDFYDKKMCAFRHVKHHQVLAIERGAKDGALSVSVQFLRSNSTDDKEKQMRYLRNRIRSIANKTFVKNKRCRKRERLIDNSAEESWKRLIRPALVRETRKKLREDAHADAIECFANNVKSLLMQPTRRSHNVLGCDPGFRFGCKLATVDNQGSMLQTATIWPVLSSYRKKRHKGDSSRSNPDPEETILRMIKEDSVSLIALGNGTASKDMESWLLEVLKRKKLNIPCAVVNEAGASVYSTSDEAREEFGSLDPLAIGAISIARRLQNPLSELVKVPPASLGVGMYQHDISQKALEKRLDTVVSTVVSNVGVDVNTASVALLRHISGLNKKTAMGIYQHARKKGRFRNRQDLKNVTGIGPKSFEQAAGFLKIIGGNEKLDETSVHPESYSLARKVLRDSSYKSDLKEENDIIKQIQFFLKNKQYDPRGKAGTIINSGPKDIRELKVGSKIRGTVTNCTNFGAFLDIGVGTSALLHNSQIGKAPVSIGNVLDLIVLKVDVGRERIGVKVA
jgi:uncharacterized protein